MLITYPESTYIKNAHEKLRPAVTYINRLDHKSRVYSVVLILATALLLLTSTYAGSGLFYHKFFHESLINYLGTLNNM